MNTGPFTFEYDEDTKAVKPVDSGMEKVAKDRAGHGWRKWTREELIAHIIDSSELLVDDEYISKEWVDSLLQTRLSRRPTSFRRSRTTTTT